MVIGIIPAAGPSVRMRYPKGLLTIGGETLLRLQCRALLARAQTVTVVVGWAGRAVAGGSDARVRVVRVEGWWLKGQIDSVRAGLPGLGGAAVLVQPVDVPPPPEALLDALLAAGGDAVPVWAGRRGHPVLLSPETALRLHRACPPDGLRTVLGAAREVDVDDERITWNLNHPRDLARWLAVSGG